MSVFQFEFRNLGVDSFSVWMNHPSKNYSRTFSVKLVSDMIRSPRTRSEIELALDLIELAICVQSADWLAQRDYDLPSDLYISVPLRFPNILDTFKDNLSQVLYWYTGDNWHFEFSKRSTGPRKLELQQRLPYLRTSEVCLWSGGLDAFAGLCNRLINCGRDTDDFLLVGGGSDKYTSNIQTNLANKLMSHYSGLVKYDLLPIRRKNVKGIPKNSWSRSRGFVFVLLGVMTSFLEGQKALSVYENGVGAINLPLLKSSTGLDHARSVHPKSLSMLQELVSKILGSQFIIQNPFLFSTKAEMCQIFHESEYLEKLIPMTVSCDKKPHINIRQCGMCTSCLLRQQALIASGIADITKYAITHSKALQRNMEPLNAMLNQAHMISKIMAQDNPWLSLVDEFPVILEVLDSHLSEEEETKSNIVNLYRKYVTEWEFARGILIERVGS